MGTVGLGFFETTGYAIVRRRRRSRLRTSTSEYVTVGWNSPNREISRGNGAAGGWVSETSAADVSKEAAKT